MGLRTDSEAICTKLLHGSASLTMTEALSDLLAEETRLSSMSVSHTPLSHNVLACVGSFSEIWWKRWIL